MYGDSGWKDKLTQYKGQTITYDEIGNPLQYIGGLTFEWEAGRQLSSISKDGASFAQYSYDESGIRQSKAVNGAEIEYYYDGSTLIAQRGSGQDIDFFYDESGSAYAIKWDGSKYYFVKNLQGDVLHILDNMGSVVVSYAYDAWGKVYSVTGSLADTLGQINPIRYRSYYYDTETGFYYLNSRYYDPEVKRFINADSNLYPQTGLLGVNLFAYCRNNPVNLYDENGEFGKWLKGLALAAVGVVAVVTSVATLGAATPLWVGVAACVGIAGGSACIVMGASEMAEAHTGTNVVKETVFNGDDQSYNTARNIAQASAEIGSGIAAVGKAATDYIAKKSITKAASSGVPFKTGQKVGTVQIGVNPNTLKINRPILPDKMKAIKFEAKLNGGISRPIQVYSNGVIYDGNHRVAYARQIGAAVDTIVIFN